MAREVGTIEAILEKTKCGKWEERELFLDVPHAHLKDFVANLASRFDTRLTSISAIEHSVDFQFFYHLVVNNVPVNLITRVSKETCSLPSLGHILDNATVYEEEFYDILKERGLRPQ